MQVKSIVGVVLGMHRNVFVGQSTRNISKRGESLGYFCDVYLCFSWSYGSIFVSKADLPKNFFVSTGYQMMSAGVLLLTISFGLQESLAIATDWSL